MIAVFGSGWRHGVIMVLMVVCSLLVAGRLVDLQLMQHDHLLQAARSQYIQSRTLQPERGMIYDADGKVLVTSLPLTKVAIFPGQISEDDAVHQQAMAQVASILGYRDPYGLWARVRLAQKNHWTYTRLIPQEVSLDVANRLSALHIPWLDLVSHDVAAYPNGTLAAQVLGFVSIDPNSPTTGHGQYGVEQYYDAQLRGTPRLVPAGGTDVAPSGASLHLTISGEIQQEVEQILQTTVAKAQADGGTVIVMDPHTGAIMAMANWPTYDPNTYNQAPYANYVNPAISVPYEPGSTFKILNIAAGLDSGRISPQTTVYDSGSYYCAGYQITNWTGGTGWGWETPMKMLRYSANIGALKFAKLIGAPTFYRYMHAFGVNQPTGIDLAGEVPGYMRFPDDVSGWGPCDLLTNAYGQGVQVTPLQLITAVAAVANDGWMMRPYVVGQIQNGSTITTTQPRRVRQVMSAATARTMTDILEESARNGEASLALVDGYGVSAKTGTAQVAGAPSCGYNCNLGTIASLIGFAPAHNPRFIALVIVKHPRTSPWGSTVAAPAFHDIAQRLFLLLGIAPNSADAK